MHTFLVRSLVVASVVLGLVACGDDDDTNTPGTAAGASCTGARLTEAQLCTLTCKSTTSAQAKASLGNPRGATASNGTELLDYSYTCVENSTASSVSWNLYFSDGVLQSVGITGIGSFSGEALPACISSCNI